MPLPTTLYAATQSCFFLDVLTNKVVEQMEEADSKVFTVSEAEKRSWEANVYKIKELLEGSGVTDTFIVFEYFLPFGLQRIDCMLLGKDALERDNVILIELKQWSNQTVHCSTAAGNFRISPDSVSALTGGCWREVEHPSQQVRGYCGHLQNFVDVISKENWMLTGVAYCYNYSRNPQEGVATLFDPQFDKLQKDFRTYAKEDTSELMDKIQAALCNSKGADVFEKMLNSPIKASQKLLDALGGLFSDSFESKFSLLAEQIKARNSIFDSVRNQKNSAKKSIIVVQGGPGTGKTVIALHVLVAAAKHHYQVRYATKSASLIHAIHYQLADNPYAKKVIMGLNGFVPSGRESDLLDVLLIDEAHRIEEYYRQFDSFKEKHTQQIDLLLQATKVLVVFMDDKQVIRSSEVGSSKWMEACARRNHADIKFIQLQTQFRCAGADKYLEWLDQVIYNQPVTSHFSTTDYELRFFDSPQEMYDLLVEKQSRDNLTARLMAGFCWPWSEGLDNMGKPQKDVVIGDFAMPWETHRTLQRIPEGYVRWYEWAYRPEGMKQVGCIYTAQGFEFDYAGVVYCCDPGVKDYLKRFL